MLTQKELVLQGNPPKFRGFLAGNAKKTHENPRKTELIGDREYSFEGDSLRRKKHPQRSKFGTR